LSAAGANAIAEARAGGRYASIEELVFRSGINKKDLEALAAADALRELSGDRHRAFWQVSGIEAGGQTGQAELEAGLENGWEAGLQRHSRNPNPLLSTGTMPMSFCFASANADFGVDVLLPVASESQNIVGDYSATGFTLRRHPLALFRQHLNKYQVAIASDLSGVDDEATVKVTGLVTCRQRPMTAAGVTFITMEDETGCVNVVVWPSLGEKLRPIVRQAMLLGVVGHVQKSDGVIHLIARELVDLSHWLGAMEISSRDFS
jgi:error-prone DNA polymerase